MATISLSHRLHVMLTVGILAALLGSNAAAQDDRQDRPRDKSRVTLDVSLPEMVLLPDSIPFPLQVVVQQAAPAPASAPIPTPARVSDQSVLQPQVQPPDQFPPAETVRSRFRTPPSEQTGPPEPVLPLAAQFTVTQQAPPEIATFGTDPVPPPNLSISMKDHPAVGSWFGKAVQVCATGVAPAACNGGQPAVALFMTPTLTTDGIFLGNDSFALLNPPFGPHTTAHGSWVPTSATEFTAEYVFMGNVFPPESNTVTGYRFRWLAKIISADTAVGYVNLYPLASVPLTWTPLQQDEFPAFPREALGFVTPPAGVVTDPTNCMGTGCPLVFKFTIKRVTR